MTLIFFPTFVCILCSRVSKVCSCKNLHNLLCFFCIACAKLTCLQKKRKENREICWKNIEKKRIVTHTKTDWWPRDSLLCQLIAETWEWQKMSSSRVAKQSINGTMCREWETHFRFFGSLFHLYILSKRGIAIRYCTLPHKTLVTRDDRYENCKWVIFCYCHTFGHTKFVIKSIIKEQ